MRVRFRFPLRSRTVLLPVRRGEYGKAIHGLLGQSMSSRVTAATVTARYASALNDALLIAACVAFAACAAPLGEADTPVASAQGGGETVPVPDAAALMTVAA